MAARILLVDDDPGAHLIIVPILAKAGYSLISAKNGEQALHMALNERPDLIIMDVIMPGMNGFQATRTLTRDPVTASVPIVMITTKSMETDQVWGLRQGARAFITKPVSEKDLLACINDLLPSST